MCNNDGCSSMTVNQIFSKVSWVKSFRIWKVLSSDFSNIHLVLFSRTNSNFPKHLGVEAFLCFLSYAKPVTFLFLKKGKTSSDTLHGKTSWDFVTLPTDVICEGNLMKLQERKKIQDCTRCWIQRPPWDWIDVIFRNVPTSNRIRSLGL